MGVAIVVSCFKEVYKTTHNISTTLTRVEHLSPRKMSCKDSPKYYFNACRKELQKATDRIYIPSKCLQHSISNWLKGSPLPKFVLILVQPFMPLLGEQISSHIRLRLRQDEAIPV